MAKSIAELDRRLSEATSTLTNRIDALLLNEVAELQASSDKTVETLHDLRREIDLLKQRVEDHLKRVEKWDNRIWGLILLAMTLAVGLVVAVVKK